LGNEGWQEEKRVRRATLLTIKTIGNEQRRETMWQIERNVAWRDSLFKVERIWSGLYVKGSRREQETENVGEC
jgi:hypothetical protein